LEKGAFIRRAIAREYACEFRTLKYNFYILCYYYRYLLVQVLIHPFPRFNNTRNLLTKCDMFTVSPQPAEGEKRGQNTVPVMISEHAQEQWAARTPAEISLKTAWERSVAVEAPEADSTAARLYPPYDALLLVQHATMATVLNNDGRLNTSGLIECPSCEDWVDPVEDDDCPWCGEDCTGSARPGSVTLTRGEI
jgi:hypothetical protein